MLAGGFMEARQVAERPVECVDAGSVLVRSNQKVRAGVPIIQIYSRDFAVTVRSAGVSLVRAEADLASARAMLNCSEEELAYANVSPKLTEICSATVQAEIVDVGLGRHNAPIISVVASRHGVDTRCRAAEQSFARAQAI